MTVPMRWAAALAMMLWPPFRRAVALIDDLAMHDGEDVAGEYPRTGVPAATHESLCDPAALARRGAVL